MLRRPTNLFRQAMITSSKPRVVRQLRTFCQGKSMSLTIKDPNWPNYFTSSWDPNWSSYFTSSKDVGDHELRYYCPLDEFYSEENYVAHWDLAAVLSWRWAKLPDDNSIAWEARTQYLDTCDSPRRTAVHPFRSISESFIERTPSEVRIGAIVPVNLWTHNLLEKLKSIKSRDQVMIGSLVQDMFNEYSNPQPPSASDLRDISMYLNWTLTGKYCSYECEIDFVGDNIRMMGCARIFRDLFRCRVQQIHE